MALTLTPALAVQLRFVALFLEAPTKLASDFLGLVGIHKRRLSEMTLVSLKRQGLKEAPPCIEECVKLNLHQA
jgi:hypothetical protein